MFGNQTSFADIDPIHSNVACIDCHGGVNPADFDEAHSPQFGFTRDPSINAEVSCGPCHQSIVATNVNSMHSKLWGERTAIAQRQLGSDKDHNNFDECPAEITDGFDQECASCHTTCGQCHISRPNSVGGGLIQSHRFNRIPDQVNNCMACHGSRIAVDYMGELVNNVPDVHYMKSMKCWDCHTEDMHADASMAQSRYHVSGLPQCIDCHSDDSNSNLYHIRHWPGDGVGLSCQVCHSQPYNNCNSCHTKDIAGGENADWWKNGYGAVNGETDVHEGGGNYREYPSFKIGYNYNQELHSGKWIVVRHIPVARDSYSPWGHLELAQYDSRPTWEYSSPHNIRKYTAQTDTSGGVQCYENCHLTGDDSEFNSDRYLWLNFIESEYPDEINANSQVVVDEHVPDNWQQY